MIGEELLAAAETIRRSAAAADLSLATLPIAAVGWATVDHERAMGELDGALGKAGEPWQTLARDAVLGASVRERSLGAELPLLLVLEPDTEGPLAASLVRFGEGVAVVYLGPAAGVRLDGVRLGGGRLVRGGPAWGPHVVVLE